MALYVFSLAIALLFLKRKWVPTADFSHISLRACHLKQCYLEINNLLLLLDIIMSPCNAWNIDGH